MVFLTDIDKTLIFSKAARSDVLPIAYYRGKVTNYMTVTAVQLLQQLSERVQLVPVTSRSIAELNRIELISATKYAIVDNGGTILEDGNIHMPWCNMVNQDLKNYDLGYAKKVFSNIPENISAPAIVDGRFIFCKSNYDEKARRDYLEGILGFMYKIYIDGIRTYAIPKPINKLRACKYLCEEILKEQPTFAAGDDFPDLEMLQYASIGLIPAGSELAKSDKSANLLQLGKGGVDSSESILRCVLEYINA